MFFDEFIPTLEGEQGIFYTHPENLPGENSLSNLYQFAQCTPSYFTSYDSSNLTHNVTDILGLKIPNLSHNLIKIQFI